MFQPYGREVAEIELEYLIKKMVRDILWDDFRMAEVAKNDNLLEKVKDNVMHSLRPERHGTQELLSDINKLKELVKEIMLMMKKRDRLPTIEYANKLSSINNEFHFERTALKVNNLESHIEKESN